MLVQTSWYLLIRTNYIYTKNITNINHVSIMFWLPNYAYLFILDGPGLDSHEDGASNAVMDAGKGAQFLIGSSSSSKHCSSTSGTLMHNLLPHDWQRPEQWSLAFLHEQLKEHPFLHLAFTWNFSLKGRRWGIHGGEDGNESLRRQLPPPISGIQVISRHFCTWR